MGCRACLTKNNTFEWTINIKNNLTYAELFFAFTKLQKSSLISEKYDFLCTQCAEALNSFVDFIEKAHRTDRILRSLARQKTDGFEMVMVDSAETGNKPNVEELDDDGECADFKPKSTEDEPRNEQQEEESACFIKCDCETDIDDDDLAFEELMAEDDIAPEIELEIEVEQLENVPHNYQVEEQNLNHSETTETKDSIFKETISLSAKAGDVNPTEESYPCMVCGKTFAKKTNRNRHIKRTHRDDTFECEVCGRVFRDKDNLKRHMKGHIKRNEVEKLITKTEDNPEEDSATTCCEKCSKNFKTNKLLKEHIARMHHDKPRLLCHSCPLTFKNERNLKRHAQIHRERKRNYECEQCGVQFYLLRSHEDHMASHDPYRKPTFHCDQCDKSFFHGGALSTHKRTHRDAGFDCSVCQKRCYRQVDLEIHLRSHTNERPFECEECGKTFKHKHMLNDHKRRHAGYKLKCDMCDEEFNIRSTLMVHRSKHTGYPARCAICNKGCAKLYALRKHISQVHKITNAEEIQRNICRVKFPSRYKRPNPKPEILNKDTVESG